MQKVGRVTVHEVVVYKGEEWDYAVMKLVGVH